MMLREISSEAAVSIPTAVDAVDPDDYYKLGQQLRRLLDRVSLPRRWTRDDIRDVQKSLKDTLRELDRQCASAVVGDPRVLALRRARAELTMSVAAVPTPAWYLCVLAAWEAMSADLSGRRSN